MKKFIALFLVFSILVLSTNLFAKERQGAELIIHKTDRTQVRGELIAVKQNSLLLLERESGADATVNVDDISVITIVKKSKFLLGAGLGLLIGGGAGAGLGAIAVDRDNEMAGLAVLGGGILGAGLGLLIGGGYGAFLGENKTIQISGKSPEEIQEVLEKLRKKARIKNLQ